MNKKKQKVLKLDAPEYRIAQKQLLMLEEIANNRILTIEEAKLYDIYTKNIVLVKQNAVVESDDNIKIEKTPIQSIPEEKLFEVAGRPPEPKQIMTITEMIESTKK